MAKHENIELKVFRNMCLEIQPKLIEENIHKRNIPEEKKMLRHMIAINSPEFLR